MPKTLQLEHDIVLGRDLSQPLVDLEDATRIAKKKLFALRGQSEVRAEKQAIIQKHGSRRRLPKVKKSLRQKKVTEQHTLDF
jgi:deoxyribodipyrimidine photo-lyase